MAKQCVGYQCKAEVTYRRSGKNGVIIEYGRHHEIADDRARELAREMSATILKYELTPIFWTDAGYEIDGRTVSLTLEHNLIALSIGD